MGWRILGIGKHQQMAIVIDERLRSTGCQATRFVLTNDKAGDVRLTLELTHSEYDSVAIGGYINGRDAVNFPATEEVTSLFNRVINIVHTNAPRSKIILESGPEDIVPVIERSLGRNPQSWAAKCRRHPTMHCSGESPTPSLSASVSQSEHPNIFDCVRISGLCAGTRTPEPVALLSRLCD